MIDDDFRIWLLSDPVIASHTSGNLVSQNMVPQGEKESCVWYGRATTESEDALDDNGAGPFVQIFDVECISDDVIKSTDMATALINKHPIPRTTLGGTSTQAIFITDHSDDYIWRGVHSDDGRHVAAVQVEVVGYGG